jgi:hypothetical protein
MKLCDVAWEKRRSQHVGSSESDADFASGSAIEPVIWGRSNAPGFFTLTAALVRMAWSRSVAVMFRRSPSASMRKLERIGIVSSRAGDTKILFES